MICLVLPRRSGIAIHFQINLLRVLISGSMTYTMSWSLSFPRIISRGSKIFQSVLQGDIEGTKALFGDQSASSKDQTECGTTLLHIASGAQNVEMVRLLIREGADSNTPDQDGQTPLHEALAVEDNFDTARLLIENGADLANKTTEDRTPLHTFFTNTVRQVVSNADWMEETDADSEGLTLTHFLAWSNRSTVIDFQRGRAHDVVDIWAPDMRGRTCLHLAAYRGNMPVLEHLLEQTSTQEVQRTDRQGLTPLHYAVRSSRAVPTIDALLAKGSILSTRDCMGAGMLHHAGSWNNLAAVKHIAGMENGRRLLVPDIHGRLPSEYCKGEKACDVRKELLRMEADIALQFSANEDMSSRHRANDYVPQGSQGLLLMKEWYHGTNALGRNRVAFEYVIWLLVASIIVLILYKVDEGQ